MTQILATGFVRTRLDERLAALDAAMQSIFGDDIDLNPDGVDGQTVGIYAEAHSDIDQLAEETYQSFNPQSARGAALSRLVQLNGIRRNDGAFSTVTMTLTGTEGTLIEAGSLIRASSGNAVFQTLADLTIDGSGTGDVAAQSTVEGAVAAPGGILTNIATPIYGWHGATNANAATLGRDEENDEALRIRRRASTVTSAQGLTDALRGALLNIPDVLQAEVFENDEDTADDNGQPAHSIYCVVDGGISQTIWDTIWLKSGMGVTKVGDVVGNALDSRGNPHSMKFSRPDDVNIYVVVNLHTKMGWPGDGDVQIKNMIMAWALANQKIGEEVIQSSLYDPINDVGGSSIDSLLIGTAPTPTTETNIAILFDQIARFDVSRITVNVTT